MSVTNYQSILRNIPEQLDFFQLSFNSHYIKWTVLKQPNFR